MLTKKSFRVGVIFHLEEEQRRKKKKTARPRFFLCLTSVSA